ncbi:MAG TPA: T9SS type A sorting domain-containing protein [Bacteroidia bacterium]|nr:T9SS type A sorting domain-containing protein [Bacteroidia bacterium]
MKKNYLLIFSLLIFLSLKSFAQGTFCDSTGNVVIFSNYDGGTLRINVDLNIPNLKIGINGYENDSIILSGTNLGNVTEVIFAGYYNSANVHCSPWPSVKSINGVSSAIAQIVFLPPAIYSNPNGNATIVCNYSCDVNSSQGGCNTADQIASFFFSMFGSSNLMFHYTQYGCWNGTYNLSDGGNCCAVPLSTNISENISDEIISLFPNPSGGKFIITDKRKSPLTKTEIEIVDIHGSVVFRQLLSDSGKTEINLTSVPKGIYLLKYSDGNETVIRKIVLQ